MPGMISFAVGVWKEAMILWQQKQVGAGFVQHLSM